LTCDESLDEVAADEKLLEEITELNAKRVQEIEQ